MMMTENSPEPTTTPAPKGRRGFASITPEKRRQIASMGGKAVPREKRSYSINRQLASEAGRKGGLAVPNAKRTWSRNHQLAAVAGRKGGLSKGGS